MAEKAAGMSPFRTLRAPPEHEMLVGALLGIQSRSVKSWAMPQFTALITEQRSWHLTECSTLQRG